METESELNGLKAKIKLGYILWIVSILSVIGIAKLYRSGNPGDSSRTESEERTEIERDRETIDILNANLLCNQRALKGTQRDLLQVESDYTKAVAEIRRLQTVR